MAKQKREASRLDTRAAILEAELRRVQKQLRSASRGRPLPIDDTIDRPVPPPIQPTPVRPLVPGEPTDDLFAHAARRPGPGEPQGPAGRMEAAGLDKHKFGRYFTSGSFVSARPLAVERRHQRNRALFMIVIVIVFAFIIFSLVRGL